MKLNRGFLLLSLLGVFGVAIARAQEPVQEAIPNWPAPETWSPHSVSRGVSTMGAVTSPLPFIGLAPCRIADTRNPAGPYGAPALAAGVPRNFTLTGQCGIPTAAAAASLNVTVTNTQGPGFILIYPQGGSQPTVSTLNYVAGQTIANAAVVPLGTGGGITVIAGVSGTDLIVDANGYYAPAGVGANNTFLGRNAGNFTMTGDQNTGVGHNVLSSNTTGFNNTATGNNALVTNDAGSHNTASGSGALFGNTTGTHNTATGSGALLSNVLGSGNTASGAGALGSATGESNIGIGNFAGSNLTTGSNDICIGNSGVAGESSVIRIGTVGTQTATFVAGINATGVTGVPVLVSSSGQLGVASSSRCVKEEIREIAQESDGLMRLRPVAFRYKPEIDPAGHAQYGLIAEEVAGVYPDLVVSDRQGKPETVRYQLVNALLLNEVQKQHRTIESQQEEIEAMRARLAALEARLLAESRP
jgi:hypothetical protein